MSRRLAAIGRITAGVGHEVKNPINAMVVHLELLRGKLSSAPDGGNGAQRHVEILASEMQRLDRVVQTLADFSRPMELRLKVVDLRDLVASVIDLTWEQMRESHVTVEAEATREALLVYVDSDLVQAGAPEPGLEWYAVDGGWEAWCVLCCAVSRILR